MAKAGKQISNPYSTGGGGTHFENRVQTAFTILMLAGGFSPCLPTWPIEKIKLQGKDLGYEFDDMIVFCKAINKRSAKLLCQIKHSVNINKSSSIFGEIIQAAWSDFNNSKIFNENTDGFALITGPLSANNTNDVRNLLERARYTNSAEKFIKDSATAKYVSNGQRKKLKVFREHINEAIKKSDREGDITDDELWRFLKSFHLLIYDLDIKGVTLSLLHTIIDQNADSESNSIWTQVKDHVERQCERAGLITLDTIPDEICSLFEKKHIEKIPKDYVKSIPSEAQLELNNLPYTTHIALAVLIGSWYEDSEADRKIVHKITSVKYDEWIKQLREVLHLPQNDISFKNGYWQVHNRSDLLKILGSRIFDEHLERFFECATMVLSEYDPKFELVEEERFSAGINGVGLNYSHSIRKSLSESIALLGCYSSSLSNCSLSKRQDTAILTVREIFKESDWKLWATLNNLLPAIAEGTPNEFLKSIEKALQQTPCPFDEVFAQEGKGITGSNYITGLLWALEALAWENEFFIQSTLILGVLASHDPGGNWANRPSNSLSTIFLPWMPQTLASIEKREVAVVTLKNEQPDVAWKLLLTLLPHHHQVSHGSYKPKWRITIPDDMTGKVTDADYWKQTDIYGELAVDLAKENLSRLNGLIDKLDNLPISSLNKLLTYLSSEDVSNLDEVAKFDLWNSLTKLTAKHKRHPEADWALSADYISKVDKLSNKLKPESLMLFYLPLFNGRDFESFEEGENWEEQTKKLEKKRQDALKLILDDSGINSLFELAEKTEAPHTVGRALGVIANESIDAEILPSLLDNSNTSLSQFTHAFVLSRFQNTGWSWVDPVFKSEWTESKRTSFLLSLPFEPETWKRVSESLQNSESSYWEKVSSFPFNVKDKTDLAVDKLIEHKRPLAALECLYYYSQETKEFDTARAIKALLSAVTSIETSTQMTKYYIVETIKMLQEEPSANAKDLFKVEWAYISILDGSHGAKPRFIENLMSTDPKEFCGILKLIYHSKNEPKSTKEPTDAEIKIASNAYDLLRNWKKVPGIQNDGSFNEKQFKSWIKNTKKICSKSGHLDAAIIHIGKVLYYSPADPDGLWIHKTVANELNKNNAEKMRNEYCIAIYNSRGAHLVDRTGQADRNLAEKYRKQAEEVENNGFNRLATSLRKVAQSYDSDADSIIDQYDSSTE